MLTTIGIQLEDTIIYTGIDFIQFSPPHIGQLRHDSHVPRNLDLKFHQNRVGNS